jgi:hypothetical protein
MDRYQEYPVPEEAAGLAEALDAAGWPEEPLAAMATPAPKPAAATSATPVRTARLRVIMMCVSP